MNISILIVAAIILIALPAVSADIIIQQVNESSGAIIDKNLNVDLLNATVNINVGNSGDGNLEGYFRIHSNEKSDAKIKIYLKANGEDCYNGNCHVAEDLSHSTRFTIYSYYKILNDSNDNYNACNLFGNDEYNKPYYECESKSIRYPTTKRNFTSTEEFILKANETIVLYVAQPLFLPFSYYLDSLSTFKKANHEKIIIRGNVNVTFNDKYPAKLISDDGQNKLWVWEYSNLDTTDENLKDILVINRDYSKPSVESFWQKIIFWFKNLF